MYVLYWLYLMTVYVFVSLSSVLILCKTNDLNIKIFNFVIYWYLSILKVKLCRFYSYSYRQTKIERQSYSFANAVYATGYPSVCPSVRPSVCPSHSGIVLKRGNAEGCGLDHRVAQCQ